MTLTFELVMYELREVEADDVRPLRTTILRPAYEEGRLASFEADEREGARHFGLAADDGEMRAVVSYLPASPPDVVCNAAGPGASLQLRGMAVGENWQRRGLGSRLLEGSLARLAVLEPQLEFVWCKARTSASGFYESHDFERCGEPFDIESLGTHVHMWRPTLEAIV